MRLHPTLYLVVVEVPPFMNERLTYLVVGSIVQVLGLECCFVNHAVARVVPVDTMLLNELHAVHPLCFSNSYKTIKMIWILPGLIGNWSLKSSRLSVTVTPWIPGRLCSRACARCLLTPFLKVLRRHTSCCANRFTHIPDTPRVKRNLFSTT